METEASKEEGKENGENERSGVRDGHERIEDRGSVYTGCFFSHSV